MRAASSADASLAPRLAALVASLSPGVHFDTDEYGRDVELTEAGIEHVERVLGCGGLHRAENLALLTELNCALHARVLLRRDVDYIVRDGRIEIVDEFTGRVVADRHWPDGLQAALEAKEGLERRPTGAILGSMTLQRFLRGYPRLCGMTGTAQDCRGRAAAALRARRRRHPDPPPDGAGRSTGRRVHAPRGEGARDRRRDSPAHATGRPVLVGTVDGRRSRSAWPRRLRDAGVACEVLNAKNDAEEAPIVARAGALGAVTISTNMAGRGTDIRLGGDGEAGHADRVAALGGLYVIGTNRHESRRVDLQLRGRAGRQGDPGESRFFVSLEDDLLVRYGIHGSIPARYLPERSDAPIESPVVRREVARAQRIVEGQNFEIRRTLARYAAVVEEQHRAAHRAPARAFCSGRTSRTSGRARPSAARRSWRRQGSRPSVDAERAVTLGCIDRAWRDHLAFCADLREGIHLVRLGGQDPLTRFTSEAIQAFSRMDDAIDEAVLAALASGADRRRSAGPHGHRPQGPVVDLDLPRERRPVPQSHRRDAHRSRWSDGRDLLSGGHDAAADRVGSRRESAAAGHTAPSGSVWQVGTYRNLPS